MSELLCSTGALLGKANGRNYHLLEELCRLLDCDGFEFMMYSSWYGEVEEIITFLRNTEIHVPVMHCDKHIGEKLSMGKGETFQEALRLFRINCQIADALHIKKMVIHLWDGMTSDQYFENNRNAYPYLREIAEEYGVDLLVENVVCAYENPLTHWCELAEYFPDIHFVFDTKMAAFHKQEELLYEPEYRWLTQNGHIRHYHVNDYRGAYKDWGSLRTLPVGKGQIDFGRFFDFVRQIEYDDTFTVEATAFNREGKVDIPMLNQCFIKIRSLLSEK